MSVTSFIYPRGPSLTTVFKLSQSITIVWTGTENFTSLCLGLRQAANGKIQWLIGDPQSSTSSGYAATSYSWAISITSPLSLTLGNDFDFWLVDGDYRTQTYSTHFTIIDSSTTGIQVLSTIPATTQNIGTPIMATRTSILEATSSSASLTPHSAATKDPTVIPAITSTALSEAAKIGLGVGIAVACILALLLTYLLVRRQCKRQEERAEEAAAEEAERARISHGTFMSGTGLDFIDMGGLLVRTPSAEIAWLAKYPIHGIGGDMAKAELEAGVVERRHSHSLQLERTGDGAADNVHPWAPRSPLSPLQERGGVGKETIEGRAEIG